MVKSKKQRIDLFLLFVFFFLSVTACGLATSQDKEPTGETTKKAEVTATPEVNNLEKPTNSVNPTPTSEPTEPIEPQPVEKLDLCIEGEIHEEKLDDLLKGYEDTGEDITVALNFGEVPSEEAKKAFFERYPKLNHYRVLGFLGTERPFRDELLLKIPFAAVKELTKDDAVISVSLFYGYPDNETLLQESITVVGTIDGKNVYDALHDPIWGDMDNWIFTGVTLKGWLTKALLQMKDDEYVRIVVCPSLQPELIDAVTNKDEWLQSEEAKIIEGEIITELTVDVFQPIYEAGWIVTSEEEQKKQPARRFLCAITTKKQLEDITLPENATFGYFIYFYGCLSGRLQYLRS